MHCHPSPSGVVFQLRARVGRSWCRTALPDMNARFFPATEDYGHYEELPGEPGEHLFPEHPLEPDSFSEGGPPGRPKPGAGVPDFLPSAQRALYLRIQQKQQEEERARRLAESSKQDRENEEGTCPPPGQGSPHGHGPWPPCGEWWGVPRSGVCVGQEPVARRTPAEKGKTLVLWRRAMGWSLEETTPSQRRLEGDAQPPLPRPCPWEAQR